MRNELLPVVPLLALLLTACDPGGLNTGVGEPSANPFGCTIRPNDPHLSTHAAQKGERRINAQVTIRCEHPATDVSVTSVLYRRDAGHWTEIDRGTGKAATLKAGNKLGANANAPCAPGTYETRGLAAATLPDGRHVKTEKELVSKQITNPCDKR
ncbi:hypothetical protein [Streptoalloteichus hindustanus]|uniref:Uncharacterized protein n=1 Tax=Streptoalloteichus hindustanus TaxID=2017 RepID=A0A1M5EXQ7_STRHI|nr:hypothetical protein [Streptoalloteichus hindustanus]SHF84019.1 hypothetical protein SAMN05444320_105186 [Streptoalloteichus hindustanus]